CNCVAGEYPTAGNSGRYETGRQGKDQDRVLYRLSHRRSDQHAVVDGVAGLDSLGTTGKFADDLNVQRSASNPELVGKARGSGIVAGVGCGELIIAISGDAQIAEGGNAVDQGLGH